MGRVAAVVGRGCNRLRRSSTYLGGVRSGPVHDPDLTLPCGPDPAGQIEVAQVSGVLPDGGIPVTPGDGRQPAVWFTVEVPAPGLEPGTDPTTNRQRRSPAVSASHEMIMCLC